MARENHRYVATGCRIGGIDETITITFYADSDDEAWKKAHDEIEFYDFTLYREIHRDSQLQPTS